MMMRTRLLFFCDFVVARRLDSQSLETRHIADAKIRALVRVSARYALFLRRLTWLECAAAFERRQPPTRLVACGSSLVGVDWTRATTRDTI